MKAKYDFSKGRRGAVVKPAKGKERITIRIDKDILNWFRDKVESAGGGSYQKLINDALREKIGGTDQKVVIESYVRSYLLDFFKETPAAQTIARRVAVTGHNRRQRVASVSPR